MRVIELHDDGLALQAFVVIDHDLFPVSAGGTRMLPDVDVQEVARLARAMTWKFATCRVPYAGGKAGLRFAGGDRAAVLAAYKRALEPYRDIFLTGPDMGTFPADFLDDTEDPLPLWAQCHDGLGMDDLATGHGVKAAAEAALAHLGRTLGGATVAVEGFGKVGAGTARACARAGARVIGISIPYGRGAVEILHRRGILALPDFVSNSGAVYLYDIVSQGTEPEAALAAIEAALREAVGRALATSDDLGVTPFVGAFREARDYLAEATGSPHKVLDELLPM